MANSTLPMDEFSSSVENVVLEVYCLVWLDANFDSKEMQVAERELRSIMSHVQEFKDIQQCKQYIEKRPQTERIVLVVSGRLGREIVPQIYRFPQIMSIYVYCMDKEGNKQWAHKFSKVR